MYDRTKSNNTSTVHLKPYVTSRPQTDRPIQPKLIITPDWLIFLTSPLPQWNFVSFAARTNWITLFSDVLTMDKEIVSIAKAETRANHPGHCSCHGVCTNKRSKLSFLILLSPIHQFKEGFYSRLLRIAPNQWHQWLEMLADRILEQV